MGAAVMNAKHTEGTEIQVACVEMREAGAVLLRRAQEAGEVRPDVEMVDVLRLMHGIVFANEQAPDQDPRHTDVRRRDRGHPHLSGAAVQAAGTSRYGVLG